MSSLMVPRSGKAISEVQVQIDVGKCIAMSPSLINQLKSLMEVMRSMHTECTHTCGGRCDMTQTAAQSKRRRSIHRRTENNADVGEQLTHKILIV